MSARPVTPRAAVLLAPNPGPMTLEGTNTWVLREPGGAQCVVVDPGPLHEGHLLAVAGTGPVALIVLTHGHADHSAGAGRLAELTGAHVVALDEAFRSPGAPPVGERLDAAGLQLTVVRTPGHSSDSLSLHLAADDAVLTGDTVLGRGTTVVAHPDGVLGDYLTSLRRLRELGDATVLPGHGPELPSAGRVAGDYLAHRQERLEQVRAAVAGGARTAQEVVDVVYAGLAEVLLPAARRSAQAQLLHLGYDPGPDEPGPDPSAA